MVPRHLERFETVKKIIQRYELRLASRSKKSEVTDDIEVLLGDTIGELNFLYSLSDVAFVGGSLIDHGGQNLLEPSAQSLALLSGPSLRNFSDVSNQLKENNALEIVNNSMELAEVFISFAKDESLLRTKGASAFNVFMSNRGALKNILTRLEAPLKI